MASLQKFRNHGVLLIVIVGLAMLAFILGDLLNSGSSFFHRDQDCVGQVEDVKIRFQQYEAAINETTEALKIQSPGRQLDDRQVRNQVWESLVMENILNHEGELIGMTVTPEEVADLCTRSIPHPLVAQSFSDANGQFNHEALINFLAQLNDITDEQRQQNPQIDSYIQYWNWLQKQVRTYALQSKYFALLQSMIGTSAVDAEFAYKAGQRTADISYVLQSYASVADSSAAVTDAELKKLYKKRKSLYKMDPYRQIEYVQFPIIPSSDDYANVEHEMLQLEDTFRTTDNIAAVVNPVSDIKYDRFCYSEKTIPAAYKAFAFGSETSKAAGKDDIMPLYFDANDGIFRMARIMETGITRPDSVKLRQLPRHELQPGEQMPEAQWLTESMMRNDNAALVDSIFTGAKGHEFTIVIGIDTLSFRIEDRTQATSRVRIAMLEREVVASSATNTTIYNQALSYAQDHHKSGSLRNAEGEEQVEVLTAVIGQTSRGFGGISEGRQIVQWAFRQAEKVGTISDVENCDNYYVVACLTEIHDEERATYEDMLPVLRAEATRDKKAEIISEALAKAKTIDEAATIARSEVMQKNVSLISDDEPALVGAAFAVPENQLSAPVKGNAGVYCLMVSNRAENEGNFQLPMYISILDQQLNRTVGRYLIKYLTDQANMKDNRINFE